MPRHPNNDTYDTMPNTGISADYFYAEDGQHPAQTFNEELIVRVPTIDDPNDYVYDDSTLAVESSFTPKGGFSLDVNLGEVMSRAPWFIVRRVSFPEVLLQDAVPDSPDCLFVPEFRKYLAGLQQLNTNAHDWWKRDGWTDHGSSKRYHFYTEVLKLTPKLNSNDNTFKLTQVALTVRASRVILGEWRNLRASMPPNLNTRYVYGNIRANRSRLHDTQYARYDVSVQVENGVNAPAKSQTYFDNIWPADTTADMSGNIQPATFNDPKNLSLTPWLSNTPPLTLRITVDQAPVEV
ncbi:hypothetical protein [Brevifollis gellanilyticus]|nr:hypothetical protein [Brevifollis gellanilyticus]